MYHIHRTPNNYNKALLCELARIHQEVVRKRDVQYRDDPDDVESRENRHDGQSSQLQRRKMSGLGLNAAVQCGIQMGAAASPCRALIGQRAAITIHLRPPRLKHQHNNCQHASRRAWRQARGAASPAQWACRPREEQDVVISQDFLHHSRILRSDFQSGVLARLQICGLFQAQIDRRRACGAYSV